MNLNSKNKNKQDHDNSEEDDIKRLNDLIDNSDDDGEDVLNFLKGDPNKVLDSMVESVMDDEIEKAEAYGKSLVNVNKKIESPPVKPKIKLRINKPIETDVSKNDSIPNKDNTIKLNSMKSKKEDIEVPKNDIFEGLEMKKPMDEIMEEKESIEEEVKLIDEEAKTKAKKSKKPMWPFNKKNKDKKPKNSKDSKKEKKEKETKEPKISKPSRTEKAPRKSKKNDKNVKIDNNTDKIEEEVIDQDEASEIIEKKYKSMKQKRILTTSIILLIVVALLIFGTYNTFFKVEKSINQITGEVNLINRTTPFPTDGVEGFLKQNINTMIEDNITLGKGVNEFNVSPVDVYITSISKRSAYIANVYFTAKVKTNTGENYHNFFVALNYDYDNYSYSPASEVQITPNEPKDNVKIAKNDILSFDSISATGDEESAKAKTFIENFLMMVYNEEVDVSPYYEGDNTLGDPNSKFVRVDEFTLYADHNRNGYNAQVVYILSLNEGIEYRVTNYLDVTPSGNSYIINAIL